MAELPRPNNIVVINDTNGHHHAWPSRGAPPVGRDGEIGEHLDTGQKLVYWDGAWRRQGQPTDIWVSPLVRVPYGATSGALDANDAMGDKIYFQYSVDGRLIPRVGRILLIRYTDPSDVTLAATANISTHDFTAAASDAAFTVGLEDSKYFLAPQTFSTVTDLGSGRVSSITGVNEDYYTDEQHLVLQLSTTGTPTPTAGNMPWLQIFILPLAL